MKACRILASACAAVLILYGALDPVRVRAQIVPVSVLASTLGCGGTAMAATEEAVAAVVGDLNGDAAVDVVDLLIFVDTFGKVQTDPGFNPEADFNCDGSTDVVDLLTFVEHFGT